MTYKLRPLPSNKYLRMAIDAPFLRQSQYMITDHAIHAILEAEFRAAKEMRDTHAAPFREACEILLEFVLKGTGRDGFQEANEAIKKLKALGVLEEVNEPTP